MDIIPILPNLQLHDQHNVMNVHPRRRVQQQRQQNVQRRPRQQRNQQQRHPVDIGQNPVHVYNLRPRQRR